MMVLLVAIINMVFNDFLFPITLQFILMGYAFTDTGRICALSKESKEPKIANLS